MMENCVLFDMDGTLLDSSEGIVKSVNFVRKEIGFHPLSKDEIIKYINDPKESLPKKFYNTDEYKKEHREIFEKHYFENCTHNLTPYDGARELLKSLEEHSSLTIATNSWDFFAKKMLSHCEMEHYFDLIVGANTYKASKPDPTMVNEIIKTKKAKKALLVGDSLKDAFAAKNANIPFIYVNWGYGSYEIKTPYIAKSMEELKELIEQLFNH